MAAKQRLDIVLVERQLVESREKAKRLILAGKVTVEGVQAPKPGHLVPEDIGLEVAQPEPYVSRGGYKLVEALDKFKVEAEGRVCADIGASTGGFTDVLLQRGADRVYAVDVGESQLHEKLRNHPRVVVMDRTNARFLEVSQFAPPPDLLVMDVSFISILKILPDAAKWLTGPREAVVLVKPQFEADKATVSRGRGVIRDQAVRSRIVGEVLSNLECSGWMVAGLILSPIKGGSGNVEYLAHLFAGDAPPDYSPWSTRIDVDALDSEPA